MSKKQIRFSLRIMYYKSLIKRPGKQLSYPNKDRNLQMRIGYACIRTFLLRCYHVAKDLVESRIAHGDEKNNAKWALKLKFGNGEGTKC